MSGIELELEQDLNPIWSLPPTFAPSNIERAAQAQSGPFKTELAELSDDLWQGTCHPIPERGISSVHGGVLQSKTPVAQGWAHNSSISIAEPNCDHPARRPQLSAPSHYLLDLLATHKEIEKVLAKDTKLLKTQSLADQEELERLEQARDEAMRKYAQDVAVRDTWSIWATVAQTIASSTSLIAGLSLATSAPIVAGALIASGTVSLGNLVLLKTGVWQKIADWWTKSVEDQKLVAQRLERGTAYLSLGIGLAGGAFMLGQGTVIAIEMTKRTAAQKAASAIQCGSSVLKASLDVGQKLSEKRMSDLQVSLIKLQARSEQIRMEMTQQISEIRSLLETDQAVATELQKAIRDAEIQIG